MTTATNEAQRTPGPWQVDQCTDDPTVYWLMGDGIGAGKLFDNAMSHDPHKVVAMLNAHDDLLAALRDLADEFDEFMSEHGQLDNKPLHAARAAIAKVDAK